MFQAAAGVCWIADALELSVDEAREVFAGERTVRRSLDALSRVGLGYLSLGQPSPRRACRSRPEAARHSVPGSL